jgi:hypothetical protein
MSPRGREGTVEEKKILMSKRRLNQFRRLQAPWYIVRRAFRAAARAAGWGKEDINALLAVAAEYDYDTLYRLLEPYCMEE